MNALVNIRFLLAIEAFNDRPSLIKFMRINKTLQFQFFERLLYLSKGQFNCVILRTVGNIENPCDTQLCHFVSDCNCLVGRKVVHNYGQLLSFVKFVQLSEEFDESLIINCLVIKCEQFKSASFADSCKYSCILLTQHLAWYDLILFPLAPLMCGICGFRKHRFV